MTIGDATEAECAGSGSLALVRLLQLASPALPIGAYSYSQGLEAVVESRVVRDEATARQWIGDVLEYVIAVGDAAVLWRLLAARATADAGRFCEWNSWFLVSRETRELRAETEQMGASLVLLATDLGIFDQAAQALARHAYPVTLPSAFALAAHGLGIGAHAALTGYLMSWLENQILAALKTVPLGQAAGQRMLYALGSRIPHGATVARTIDDDGVGNFAPGYALASARHEMQYSRLFRS
jgi:urease accessory protein